MRSLNKVTLIGNLGADPDIRTFSSGDKVANFSLATSDRWTDKGTGEAKERTEWHRIAVYNQALVKVVEAYVRKGHKLYVEGQLETRKWTDQQGVERYSTEVVLRPFNSALIMLSGTPATGSGTTPGPDAHNRAKADGYAPAPSLAEEDEIPF